MRWIRSWPNPMPAHRAYVVDELERLYQVADSPDVGYDYTPLGQWFTDNPDEPGVILIEWDIAVEPDQALFFERLVVSLPSMSFLPIAAAQKLHHVEPYGSVWAHRRIEGEGTRWLREWENPADYVAFGLIYLPRTPVLEFLQAEAPARGAPLYTPGGYDDCRFTDQTFSMWYRHRYTHGGPFRVEWSVRPVHLHARER